ncbi:integrase, catalytic region, zinc finger, CCHC-type containing protein, partial [Tanacetum coccineum]
MATMAENVIAAGARVINAVGNTWANQPRVIRCNNCNIEGHMAKKCTAKKMVKDSEWFKDTMLLAQAKKRKSSTTNFKADHVDAYDSDCDDKATSNAIFMANLSHVGSLNDDTVAPLYDSNTLSKGNNDVISYNDYMLNIGNDEDNYVPPPVHKECYDVVSSLVKEREHIKLEYKNLYDSIKQTRAKTKLQTVTLQQKLNDQIYENIKLRAQLKGKFSESQMNHNGTSVNTKLSKPSTSGTKICSVTLFPKSKVIPKVFEKNNLSKLVTSHLTTNKIIEKCTKVLDSGLLKIESKPIIAYFKNNRDVHHDFLKVTKEHVATPQELLEEARVLKPLDEHIGHASKFVERIQEQLVYLSAASRVSSINASGSKPKSNTKNDRIPQSSSRSMKNKVEAYHRKFKSSANKNNHVLDCLKWILTGRTFNLVGKSCPHSSSNDTSAIVFPPVHILTTTVIPVNVPFPKQRLGHNLFFVGHFCDLDLKVAFRKHTCFVRKLEGVDLLSGSCGSNLYTISMADMMKYSPICLHSEALKMKSWLWHRRLSHLKFGTINKLAKQDLVKGSPKLKYTKDLLFSVCQMGKSKKESHPHKPEPNDFEDVGKLQPKADIGIFISYSPSKKMAYEQHSLGLDLHGLTSGHITGASSSTTIDKEASSLSNLPNIEATNSPFKSTNVETNAKVAEFDSDTFTNSFVPPNTISAESSSRIVDTSNMHTFQQPPIYIKRWTKDHSLVTTIDDPSKPISTRRQLSTDALWCYFRVFLAKEEPKNYKEAMIESSWIEAMQEEIHEF